jgi:ADP-ribose pyrophosphatase YjhB (NUDIX family)
VVVTAWQNGKVFGLWHYKHGPRRVNLGLPADYLESDEDALAAARRELHEGARLANGRVVDATAMGRLSCGRGRGNAWGAMAIHAEILAISN